jgi:hypothetical protein
MAGGVIGDMLAAHEEGTGETALRGLCQQSIHNKYVPGYSFHSLPILLIFLFTVLSLISFVHSYDPPALYIYYTFSLENFYFPSPAFFPQTTTSSNHFSPY